MEDHRLSTLFDYTKFHIGLYATLITGLFAVVAFVESHKRDLAGLVQLLPYAKWTACLILIAGAAGGAIASNIPNFREFESFSRAKLEVFGIRFLRYSQLAHVEHLAFWSAIGVATYALFSFSI